jgi:ribosomal protein S18 acetylase RimI-like enzyme
MDTAVRSARTEDESAVLDVITLAFAADPMTRWSMPDPARYLEVMPKVTRAFGSKGFAHGSVFITEGGTGAAMWLPPGVGPDSETLRALLVEEASPEMLPDMEAIMSKMEAIHPKDPHWYLPMIGVDPAMHSRGLGSILMQQGLERCDKDGVPAYLESSNPRNISLYERHGFEIIGRIQAGFSPTVTPMLRKPK